LDPPWDRYLSDLNYPTMRISRKLSFLTGLTDWLVSKKFYDENCLVENPLYLAPGADCADCTDAQIYEFGPGDVERLRNQFAHSGEDTVFDVSDVFILRMASIANISLSSVQLTFREHSSEVIKHTGTFYSRHRRLPDVAKFLEAKDVEQVFTSGQSKKTSAESFVVWRVSHVNVSRHFRAHFPRAPFVPLESEVKLDKSLFVYSSRAPPFEVHTNDVTKTWLYQARGIHGLPKVSLGPAIPYHSTPFGQPNLKRP
jgi:hypothetical protein